MLKSLRDYLRRWKGGGENAPLRELSPDDWRRERTYWEQRLTILLRDDFSLALTPLQQDDSIVPAPAQAMLVQGRAKGSANGFFGSGYRHAVLYLSELRQFGFDPSRMERILEFGVGFGRLIVHYSPFRAELHGCDLTPEAVDWTRLKLGGRVQVCLSGEAPPLPYPDDFFDYVYANSVFTHILPTQFDGWIAELTRITKPGGCVICTILDPNVYLSHLTFAEFDERYLQPGSHTRDPNSGVQRVVYVSPAQAFECWSNHLEVLAVAPHFRDQSHVICRKRARNEAG